VEVAAAPFQQIEFTYMLLGPANIFGPTPRCCPPGVLLNCILGEYEHTFVISFFHELNICFVINTNYVL
jgi:hypothetical protein